VTHLSARLLALSPAATLHRGYAVLLTEEGQAVRDAAHVAPGQSLHARVARGSFDVAVQDLR
jgi:exodeoxyribonuclease VII large subunit